MTVTDSSNERRAHAVVRSRADAELIEQAREHGVNPTPRQLKRWRDEGLLPKPLRSWLGRGRGSVSEYPVEALPRVVVLASLSRLAREPVQATLLLFAIGDWADEVRLKRSHHAWLQQRDHKLAGRVGSRDPLALAEAVTARAYHGFRRTEMGRQWLVRLNGRDESAGAILQSVMTTVVMLARFGEASSDDALDEVLAATGLDEALEESAHNGGGDADPSRVREQMKITIKALALGALEQTFQNAPLARLEDARDAVRAIAAILGGLTEESWLRLPLCRLIPLAVVQEVVFEPLFIAVFATPLMLVAADILGATPADLVRSARDALLTPTSTSTGEPWETQSARGALTAQVTA